MTKHQAYNIAWSVAFNHARNGRIISYANSRLTPYGFTAHTDTDEPLFSIPRAVLREYLAQ